MGDLDRERERLAGLNAAFTRGFAIAPQFHQNGFVAGVVGDAQADGLLLPDNSEAGGIEEFDAPVALDGKSRDQGMERGAEAERIQGVGDIMDDSVGDEDRAGNPFGRDIGQGAFERREQAGSVLARGGCLDNTDFEIWQGSKIFFEFGQSEICLGLAHRERLRAASVDEENGDVFELFALLAHDGGVGEGEDQECAGEKAEQDASLAAKQCCEAGCDENEREERQ